MSVLVPRPAQRPEKPGATVLEEKELSKKKEDSGSESEDGMPNLIGDSSDDEKSEEESAKHPARKEQPRKEACR